MKREDEFSEEQLNAFVDGELDPEEKSRLYHEASHSPTLDRRLCQQRKLKELVGYAYDELPATGRTRPAPLSRSGPFGRAMVAGFVLAAGIVLGFLAHDLTERLPVGNNATQQIVAEPENYLLHVISGDPEQMHAALEYAEFLLESEGEGMVGQVEIVANEHGLDLLRSDVTPYAEEIAALQRSSVVFYACSRTIERLEEEGVKIRLVPDTRKDYTAIDRVVMRVQEGWKYEKI